jgi:hypothetical protein
MKIESYEFGKIVIDGREYTGDVVITEEGVIGNWRREEGHKLKIGDISEILDENPEVLIVGTGYSGYLKVLPETKEFIESHGLELRIDKTADACSLYNKISIDRKVIAALHLTC